MNNEIQNVIKSFFALFIKDFDIEFKEEKRVVDGSEVGTIWSVLLDVPKEMRPILIGRFGREARILTLMVRHLLKLRNEKLNIIIFIRP